MADSPTAPPLGSGAHGRDFPALPPERRAAIIEGFSGNNRKYFSGTMGFHVVDLRQGYARLTAENTIALQQPAGVMHGGASFGLADTAVAAALFTVYDFDQLFLTIEMKINYLEPIPPGEVIAEAYVLRSSRRSAYAEVDVWSQGKLAARASTTYMIKPFPPTGIVLSAADGRPHVVIVGGGFGGLACARALRRAPVHVTLVDRRNHHLFQPLLYQVATAGLSPADIAYPIRAVLSRQANANVILAEAVAIDVAQRELVLSDGRLGYDWLVLATGARHAYFGHDEWEHYAPGLKSLEDALEIRRRILLAFERAERETDPDARRALLTIVVVGGGPTGVELAGAIAEIARQVMKSDFRAIDPTETRVVLVEAGPRVLATFPDSLSARAAAALAKRGVEVRTDTRVTGIDAHAVTLGTEKIASGTILWAAGVAASPLVKSLGVPLDRAGRVAVNDDCSIPGHPEVFVVGDAMTHTRADGTPLPGVAPVAMQQGRYVARLIARDGARRIDRDGTRRIDRDGARRIDRDGARRIDRVIAGDARTPFVYVDKGNLATIGRAAAVAEIGRLKLWGLAAWVLWLVVHIMYLVGFRNRVVVLIDWAWAYVTMSRGARLITGDIEHERTVAPTVRDAVSAGPASATPVAPAATAVPTA